jgi:hypothetical protein
MMLWLLFRVRTSTPTSPLPKDKDAH